MKPRYYILRPYAKWTPPSVVIPSSARNSARNGGLDADEDSNRSPSKHRGTRFVVVMVPERHGPRLASFAELTMMLLWRRRRRWRRRRWRRRRRRWRWRWWWCWWC